MQGTWKKAGILLGHVVCISIILLCIVYGQDLFGEEEDEVQTVMVPEVMIYETPSASTTEFSEGTDVSTVTGISTISGTPVPTEEPKTTEAPALTPEPTKTAEQGMTDREQTKLKVLSNIAEGVYSETDNTMDNWWFRRKKDHVPSGSGEMFNIDEYQGFYLNENVEDGDKVIYMTIDCGYGSSNTAKMLDILQKHDIKVMFFVTKFFIEDNPEYVRRMVEEGHMVGNHSVSHTDLTSLTDEEVYAEIIECEEAFYEVTGQQMDLYFRPPEGAYSRRTMQITEDLGYKTIFWSIAYNDYDQKNQPGKAFIIDHFTMYHHNGAIPLMHNDSDSNLEAMDDVLTLLEEQGYRFGTLDELYIK